MFLGLELHFWLWLTSGAKAFHCCLLLADNVELKTSTVKLWSGERWHTASSVFQMSE